MDLNNIQNEIKNIKQRNQKVEIAKSWETSISRKMLISLLTYIVISIFFLYIGISKPYLNAIIPSIAFILSTLSMNLFKNLWIKYIYKEST